MDPRVTSVLSAQAGVIARRQVLAAGLDDNWIENRLRRRDLARVHHGVYVVHTGPVTWLQQAWAAVLFYWPAALWSRSAVVVATGGSSLERAPADPQPVEVAVDTARRVRRIDGVKVTRVLRLEHKLQPVRLPPRVRLEHALLHQASAARSDAEALGGLADACQRGWTTPGRLVDTLTSTPRLPRRAFLLRVLEDVASGAYSVLEHRYLVRVERAHGLPTAARQRRVQQGRTVAYRDVHYLRYGSLVELDGRLGHDLTTDRWHDADRDVEAALGDLATLRLTWGQVLDSCRTAALVSRLLHGRGWTGSLRACGPACTAAHRLDVGASPAA